MLSIADSPNIKFCLCGIINDFKVFECNPTDNTNTAGRNNFCVPSLNADAMA
ncbi:MAG: hypothetical protein HY051_00705 [Candidatus Aenigmarchaeota archaeon]|nr:hypothetical protein [Candidatus Aenigmarchaeota archaeon]